MNPRNLAKLALYLESLPEDYKDFGMRTFIAPSDPEKQIEYAKNNGGVHQCGTAACAVGHGPAAGILFPEDDRFWRTGLIAYYPNGYHNPVHYVEGTEPAWGEYSYEFFISADGDNEAQWEWCFGGDWARFDDTPWGAAARIWYLLSGRPLPDYFEISNDATEEIVALYQEYHK